MEINQSYSRSAIERALADPDDIDGVIGSLQVIGRRGADQSATQGCADIVAQAARRSEVKVVAAAIECLGQLGQEGAEFKDDVAAGLRHDDVSVRLAAVQALGFFGVAARGCASELARLIDIEHLGANGDKHDDVRAAAINALGLVKADSQADNIAQYTDYNNLSVSSAACMALGHLGQPGHKHAPNVACNLDSDSIRFSALNSLVLMGSSVTGKYVDKIITKCLVDKDYWCRQAAVAAIAQAADSVTNSQVDNILALLKHEAPGVRCAACMALGGLRGKGKAHASALAALLKSDDGEDKSGLAIQMGGSHRVPSQFRKVRVAALAAIGFMEAGDFAADCADHFGDKSWEVRVQAVDSVGMLGDDGAAISNHIAELLEDDVYIVRSKACEVLGKLKAENHVDKLAELFADKCPSVRVSAVEAVGQMGEEASRHSTAVFKLLNDMVMQVRSAACRALGEMGESSQSYACVIAKLLSDPDPDLRLSAMGALGKLGDHGAAFAEEVAECLRDSTPQVRDCATRTLELMSGEARHGEEE